MIAGAAAWRVDDSTPSSSTTSHVVRRTRRPSARSRACPPEIARLRDEFAARRSAVPIRDLDVYLLESDALARVGRPRRRADLEPLRLSGRPARARQRACSGAGVRAPASRMLAEWPVLLDVPFAPTEASAAPAGRLRW